MWLIIFVILLFIEIITTNLVSIWLALGALFAFITSMCTNQLMVQMIVFFAVSILTLIATRPLAKRYLSTKIEKTNYDRVLGKTAIVTKDISALELGEVKVDGKYWTAKADCTLKKDEKVEVLQIDGVKLIVRRKEEK